MNEKIFRLEIVTPKQTVFAGEVISLTAPGVLGYLGVLANHAPLVTTLVPGKVTYREAAGVVTTLQSSGNGLLDVYHNQVTLLADQITS